VTATTPGPLTSRTRSGPFRDLPREAAILSAVSFTVALGYGIVAPAIPAFARQFGVSVAAAASVISAFALMRVAGALPAGRLVDRFGSRAVMAAGISVVAVSSVLAGFSQSFVQLLVLRGVGGLGSAMFSVSAQALLLASVPGDLRGRASGLYSGGFLLGGISGPALGGIVAAWSLRAPFFLYGGLLVVPAAIAAAGLRPGARGDVPAAREAPAQGGGLAMLARALRSRAYRAAAAANLADGFAVLGVRGAIIPLFVRDSLHRSATWTGIGFLVFAALNGAALLPAGRVADTLGRRPVIVAGCGISAAGMVMLAALPGLWAFLGALAVAGFGSGLLDVAPSAMIGDLLDRRGGILVAFYQMAGDIGSVTGPVAAGFLVDSASYPAAFALAAAVLGAAALLGLMSPETRKGSLLITTSLLPPGRRPVPHRSPPGTVAPPPGHPLRYTCLDIATSTTNQDKQGAESCRTHIKTLVALLAWREGGGCAGGHTQGVADEMLSRLRAALAGQPGMDVTALRPAGSGESKSAFLVTDRTGTVSVLMLISPTWCSGRSSGRCGTILGRRRPGGTSAWGRSQSMTSAGSRPWPVPLPGTTATPAVRLTCWPRRPRCATRCGPRCGRRRSPGSPARPDGSRTSPARRRPRNDCGTPRCGGRPAR
jgi:MFS family permease